MNNNTNFFSRMRHFATNIPKYMQGVVEIGVDYGDIGQKLGVERAKTESENAASDIYGFLDDDTRKRIVDIDQLPHFKRDYKTRLEEIRKISDHPEIQFITHKITDAAVTYDNKNYFCTVELNDVGDTEYVDGIKKALLEEFNRLYSLWGFNKGDTAWAEFLKFIEEGYLAYETIYDDVTNPTKITGFQELEPVSLVPVMADYEVEIDGEKVIKKKKIWKQLVEYNTRNADRNEKSHMRSIPDESVIFVSYSKTPGNKRKFSYVEKLLRSFNMMRTIENCTVAWYVMNSQSRIKMVIPVTPKNTTKAKEALEKVKNKYKEEVIIDHDSGVVKVNGKPNINFTKLLMLPSRGGQKPDIEGINFNGPDLSRLEPLNYFRKKLHRDSELPFSKFDRDSGGGPAIEFNSRGGKEMTEDEKTFHLSISRLRREYKKILMKPLHKQMLLRFPELKDDKNFESAISLRFVGDHDFENDIKIFGELAAIEKMDKYQRVKDENNNPVYSVKYLMVNKLGIMTTDEWEENEKMKKEATSKQGNRGNDNGI